MNTTTNTKKTNIKRWATVLTGSVAMWGAATGCLIVDKDDVTDAAKTVVVGTKTPDAAATADAACPFPAYDHGGDPLYPGYEACTPARYPSFRDKQTRWDGTYPEGCVGVAAEHRFACEEQLMWQSFQFGDAAARQKAMGQMETVADLINKDPNANKYQKAHSYWHTSQVALLLVTEHGDRSKLPKVREYLEKAMAVQNEIDFDSSLKALDAMDAVAAGKSPQASIDQIREMYPRNPPAVIGAVMSLFASMPKSSGLPQVALELVEKHNPRTNCGTFCGWQFMRAPRVQNGHALATAEVYARMGNKDKAKEWLQESLGGPNGAGWRFAPDVQSRLADLDAWVASFAARGNDARVDDLMLTNTKASCIGCHDPLK